MEALDELSKLILNTFSDVNVFNIYSSYVNNLAELQKIFKEESESNQDFANFLKVFTPYHIWAKDWLSTVQETSRNFGSNLDWYSLSMKPVQKLPQLKMLLERLLKKTPKDHPDRSFAKSFWPKVDKTKKWRRKKQTYKTTLTLTVGLINPRESMYINIYIYINYILYLSIIYINLVQVSTERWSSGVVKAFGGNQRDTKGGGSRGNGTGKWGNRKGEASEQAC